MADMGWIVNLVATIVLLLLMCWLRYKEQRWYPTPINDDANGLGAFRSVVELPNPARQVPRQEGGFGEILGMDLLVFFVLALSSKRPDLR